MSNEEAIRIIEFVLGRGEAADRFGLRDEGITVYHNISKEREALDLAIKALEAVNEWDKLQLICANEGIVVYKQRGDV